MKVKQAVNLVLSRGFSSGDVEIFAFKNAHIRMEFTNGKVKMEVVASPVVPIDETIDDLVDEIVESYTYEPNCGKDPRRDR